MNEKFFPKYVCVDVFAHYIFSQFYQNFSTVTLIVFILTENKIYYFPQLEEFN